MSAELVAVTSGALDLRTYEVRLARSEDGKGPSTPGLRTFVEALRQPMTEPESASVAADGAYFLVLLDCGAVVALTAVEQG
ncbi:hypothetical protein [Nocardioides sp. AX2bis]|uniref:hypothetical protein n=1 Tax=Nocardioides sp. AX2bis TaxID=2653157 RepID=UPI001359B152|nr:hypothetical protein [Nocardioides sp. AX2bis]